MSSYKLGRSASAFLTPTGPAELSPPADCSIATVVCAGLPRSRRIRQPSFSERCRARRVRAGAAPQALPRYSSPAAMLIASASSVVLKKNASTQCSVPTRRSALVANATSAVWPEVPMTQAK